MKTPSFSTTEYPQGVDGKGGWIATYSGHYIYPLDPDPADVYIEDIAHALSNMCRFTGHTRTFYSVGQHSVLASYVVEDDAYRLWALLHDASEAYLADIARPIKHQPGFGDVYRACEDKLMAVIVEKFGLEPIFPMPAAVKKADNLLLWTEMRDLMPNDPPEGEETLDLVMHGWTPEDTERSFIARYKALGGA